MNTELFEKATRLNETLFEQFGKAADCLLYTSPSPRD